MVQFSRKSSLSSPLLFIPSCPLPSCPPSSFPLSYHLLAFPSLAFSFPFPCPLSFFSTIVSFLAVVIKCLIRRNLSEKRGILAPGLEVLVHQGEEVMAAGAWSSWSHDTHSQEAERDEGLHPTGFLLFPLFGLGPQPMGWVQFRTGLPSSVNPLCKISKEQTQKICLIVHCFLTQSSWR